jgi:hypothetical protein
MLAPPRTGCGYPGSLRNWDTVNCNFLDKEGSTHERTLFPAPAAEVNIKNPMKKYEGAKHPRFPCIHKRELE